MNRRTFLTSTAALAATASVRSAELLPVVDCNAHLGAWPGRRLAAADPAMLARKLARNGIQRAWVASFDGVLQRDLATVNRLLAEQCKAAAEVTFVPVGVINPMLPAWQDDVKRCAEQHGMTIVRLYPGYHGFKLADPVFKEAMAAVTERRLAMQIVAQLEDERTQNPLLHAAPLDLKPLPALLDQLPSARVMVLNANAAMITSALHGCTRVWLDVAMIEAVGGIEVLLKSWPADKLCLGTHAPLFYPESSALKLQESELSDTQLHAVTRANAQTFLTA